MASRNFEISERDDSAVARKELVMAIAAMPMTIAATRLIEAVEHLIGRVDVRDRDDGDRVAGEDAGV